MERFETQTAVIGAGLIGVAVARAVALAGSPTVLLEKNHQIGMETSARSSEVIHAGLYYPAGSAKARLCRHGQILLYDFCGRHGVAHRRVGKLIVAACAAQGAGLAAVAATAAANGVTDLRPLARREIAALEPGLRVAEALFSPSTGIVDSHGFLQALLGEAQAAGASLALRTEVTAIGRIGSGYRLQITDGQQAFTLDCRRLINSAGLWASHIASRIEGLNRSFIPRLFLAKGSYAALSGKCPFRHLIYPVPKPGGLGVHLTLDISGAARFGPDVEWLATDDPAAIDYAVAHDLPARFAPRIAPWWPAIDAEMLRPAYAGVRPKLSGPGAAAADFRIDGTDFHGLPGLVNLFGIESPGLTASLAIAEHVVERLGD